MEVNLVFREVRYTVTDGDKKYGVSCRREECAPEGVMVMDEKGKIVTGKERQDVIEAVSDARAHYQETWHYEPKPRPKKGDEVWYADRHGTIVKKVEPDSAEFKKYAAQYKEDYGIDFLKGAISREAPYYLIKTDADYKELVSSNEIRLGRI